MPGESMTYPKCDNINNNSNNYSPTLRPIFCDQVSNAVVNCSINTRANTNKHRDTLSHDHIYLEKNNRVRSLNI